PRRPRVGSHARVVSGRGRRCRTCAQRRATFQLADVDAGGKTKRGGLVGVRLRSALVESAVPVRRRGTGHAAGPAPGPPPLVGVTASGSFGSSLHYLEPTRVALVTHGVIDPYLEALAARVSILRVPAGPIGSDSIGAETNRVRLD